LFHCPQHSLEEKDPVPLAIHHFPLAVTFAFFSDGYEDKWLVTGSVGPGPKILVEEFLSTTTPQCREHLVVDPSLQEERVMDGRMTVIMNNFREICAVHKAGGVLLSPEQVNLFFYQIIR
jgi:exosome complex component RRP45